MEKLVLIGFSAGLLAAAGCGSNVSTGGGGGFGGGATERLSMDGHFMGLTTNNAGQVTGVFDRSSGYQQAVADTSYVNGYPDRASVTVNGTMQNGNAVPGSSNLVGDPSSVGNRVGSYNGPDAFLGEVIEGRDYAVLRYHKTQPGREYVGYGAVGRLTQNMPRTGTATFNGLVDGDAYGSQTGKARLQGTVSLGANFGGATPTIGGKMSNLTLRGPSGAIPLGSDIVMEAANIAGPQYENGRLQLVTAGTNMPNSTMVGSNYQGLFFGSGAAETGGSFQFGATGVPIYQGFGATEVMQAVGGFGASRP